MGAALSGPAGCVKLGTTTVKIGRLPENHLVVDDVQASSLHAEIYPDADGYTLVDLGSISGTFVNEQRLTSHAPRRLQAGDSIRIGDTRYTYIVENTVAYAGQQVLDKPASAPTVVVQQRVSPPSEYQSSSPVYSPPTQSSLPFSSLEYATQADSAQDESSARGSLFAWRKRYKRLWTIGGASIILLVLIGGVFGVLFLLNLPTPAKTLDAFCADIQNKRGQDAFNLLSEGLKRRAVNGKEIFISVVDSGQIVGCSHSSPAALDDNARARLTLTVTDGQSQTDTVLLIVDHRGDWKISRLQIIQV